MQSQNVCKGWQVEEGIMFVSYKKVSASIDLSLKCYPRYHL